MLCEVVLDCFLLKSNFHHHMSLPYLAPSNLLLLYLLHVLSCHSYRQFRDLPPPHPPLFNPHITPMISGVFQGLIQSWYSTLSTPPCWNVAVLLWVSQKGQEKFLQAAAEHLMSHLRLLYISYPTDRIISRMNVKFALEISANELLSWEFMQQTGSDWQSTSRTDTCLLADGRSKT